MLDMAVTREAPPGGLESAFERLMSIDLDHEYYRSSGGPGDDLELEPTAATVAMIRNLGLVFQSRPGGLDLYYDKARAGVLVRHLLDRRSRTPEGEAVVGRGTRLSFTLTSRTPLFYSFSDIPLGMTPGRFAAYLSNQGTILDDDGSRDIDVQWALAIQPINSVDVASLGMDARARVANVEPQITDIWIRDASGELVIHTQSGAAAIGVRPLINRVLDAVQLCMKESPSGLYSITATAKAENPAAPVDCGSFLHVDGGVGFPVCLLDLFLTGPADADAEAIAGFPVRLTGVDAATLTPAGAASCVSTQRYRINLPARQTRWTYYVVVPAEVGELSIERTSADGPTFGRSSDAPLPNGAAARKFVADRPWPLARRSEVALRLRLAEGSDSESRVALERLPLPSPEGLEPQSSPQRPLSRWPPDPTAVSNIYVHL